MEFKLRPHHPPAHAGRKLRGLVEEIARLRSQGYSIREIHETLDVAGITVSWSTVQRELARLAQPSSASTSIQATAIALPVSTVAFNTTAGDSLLSSPSLQRPTAGSQPPAASARVAVTKAPSDASIDVASYFDPHAGNPLFRKKRRMP